MGVPEPLVSACVALASEVSPEATGHVIDFLEAGQIHRAQALLTGDASLRLRQLLLEWQHAGESVTGTAVADVLRGASSAMVAERNHQHIQLVWSGPNAISSTLRSTGPALLELIDGARECLYIVTFAAYKIPEVSESLQAALLRGVRVVLVLENSNVSGGKVTFDPLPHLMGDLAKGLDVFIWPQSERVIDSQGKFGTLHAKFAVADNNRLLISSANLTRHAFNLNIELGALITGGSAPIEAVAHLDKLIRRRIFRRLS